MSGTEIAALVGATVTALTAAATGIVAAARYYRKAIREEGERIAQLSRAEEYKERSQETIAQKDAEISALREQVAAWRRISERSLPPSSGKDVLG